MFFIHLHCNWYMSSTVFLKIRGQKKQDRKMNNRKLVVGFFLAFQVEDISGPTDTSNCIWVVSKRWGYSRWCHAIPSPKSGGIILCRKQKNMLDLTVMFAPAPPSPLATGRTEGHIVCQPQLRRGGGSLHFFFFLHQQKEHLIVDLTGDTGVPLSVRSRGSRLH